MRRLMRRTAPGIPDSALSDVWTRLRGACSELSAPWRPPSSLLLKDCSSLLRQVSSSFTTSSLSAGEMKRKPSNLEQAYANSRKYRDRVPFQPGRNDLGGGAVVHYFPGAFAADADEMLRRLQAEVSWMQQQIFMMGRRVQSPRLISYMADDDSLSYTYSGTKQTREPWTTAVAGIKERLQQLSGGSFNSCLLNQYRDGGDSLSWHSDNEPLYGSRPTIGSVSFGAAREFLLRENEGLQRKFTSELGGGDVLIMSGTCQQSWKHCVPKRRRCDQPRISLTFRNIIIPETEKPTNS